MKSCFYTGHVWHERYSPKPHKLRYRVFSLFADLDELDQLAKRNRLFSVDRFNLISLFTRDLGDPIADQRVPLKDRLSQLVEAESGEPYKAAKIFVLTYPRVLGFTFNPLTVFYCLDEAGEIDAIIYEVRNTFGERHNYVFRLDPGEAFGGSHSAAKRFHVSPFFDRQGTYDFKLSKPSASAHVVIDYAKGEERRLQAGFKGKQLDISDKTILALSVKFPFMTLKVVLAILWEALKLWLKGIKVYTHPEAHAYQSSSATKVQPTEKQGEVSI